MLVQGVVLDAESSDPLIGANVINQKKVRSTDIDGRFTIEAELGDTITFSYVGYTPKTQVITDQAVYQIMLESSNILLSTAVVTSGRYEIPVAESTVSLEILKPELLESINAIDMEEALNKVPGLNIIDDQPNIRGGSGYAYGIGSRVLVLQDDVPVFQPDAGLVFWGDLPIENVAQIEVLKGASSTLYGSSALNGIVNLRSGYAKEKREFKVSSFFNLKLNPKDPEKKWWDTPPTEFGMNALYKEKFGKFDLVLGAFYFNERGVYREADRDEPGRLEDFAYTEYGRLTFDGRYRFNDRLTVGARSTFNPGRGIDFFYWAGDGELAYHGDPTTTSPSARFRFNIDPYIHYIDGKQNKHKLQLRYFDVDNNISLDRQNSSTLYYSEYQFQKNWLDHKLRLTAGGVYQYIYSNSELFNRGLYTTSNIAPFLQLNKKIGDKINISGGARYERYTNQQILPDSIMGNPTKFFG